MLNSKTILKRFQANGNNAYIDYSYIKPYNGASEKCPAYRVVCADSDGFIYHVSVFETMGDCINDLSKCGFDL